MAVAALNFNGFVEKNNLISYRELFASESALLKGKPLCQYLTDMDQHEYESVKLENAELSTFGQTRLQTVGIELFALSAIIFIGTCIIEACFSDKIKVSDGLIAAGIISGTAVPCIVVGREEQLLQDKINKIYDNRLLRVQDKVQKLEGRIAIINESLEKEQLTQAKNHFSLKHQRYLSERHNVLTVKKQGY